VLSKNNNKVYIIRGIIYEMETSEILEKIGLSEGEVKVYLALLKLGSVPVSKIREESGLNRTTIYDYIERLLAKGIVNYVIKNNVRYYDATDPDKLLDYVEENERNLRGIMSELKELTERHKRDVVVEVYKGEEGLKTVFNDVLRIKDELKAFGVDDSIFKEKFEHLMDYFFVNEKKLGIKERIITSEESSFTYKRKGTEYRFIPDDYFNPNPSMIYGNRVAIIIWEPFTVILMKNDELADSYKKHFELLWRQASKSLKRKK
jgi:sugar-specific transcriptional regulator TrmB